MRNVKGLSADPYDALAPHYRAYALKRESYLAAVDDFILEYIPSGAKQMLDVGSGDGVRAMMLAHLASIATVVLSDSSAEMVGRCRALAPAETWRTPAQQLPDVGRRFDVITCLWNVLGHIPTRDERLQGLLRMAGLLAPGGMLFLDVQNRHNAVAYGWGRVLARVALDTVFPDERRGDTSFDWNIGGDVVRGSGHLFTPREIRDLIDEAGLAPVHWTAVDYATGVRSKNPLCGQLAFACQCQEEEGLGAGSAPIGDAHITEHGR
jgi:2-polyprenyl-3-methyl-5-hydroxy-6-metoxy-1,4-benzoquinol methylase